tara:strand:- start:685 stop:1251 length:567 start_codon:yes stop_codon:yes gene_type:complete
MPVVVTSSGRFINAQKEGIYFEVRDLEKALKKLKALEDIDRKKARQFKAGIKKAAKPLVKSVKDSITNSDKKAATTRTVKKKNKESSVTNKSGNLKRSIAFIPSKKKGALLGYVGARFGRKAGKTFDGYYAAIVNYGLRRGKAKAEPIEKRNIGYAEKGFTKAIAQTQANLRKEIEKILNQSLFQLTR